MNRDDAAFNEFLSIILGLRPGRVTTPTTPEEAEAAYEKFREGRRVYDEVPVSEHSPETRAFLNRAQTSEEEAVLQDMFRDFGRDLVMDIVRRVDAGEPRAYHAFDILVQHVAEKTGRTLVR
jgi:hypothetical protein